MGKGMVTNLYAETVAAREVRAGGRSPKITADLFATAWSESYREGGSGMLAPPDSDWRGSARHIEANPRATSEWSGWLTPRGPRVSVPERPARLWTVGRVR
jgi:hypothetical protein